MFAHRPLKIAIRAFAQSSTDVDMDSFILDRPLLPSHALSMHTSVEILKPEVSIQKVTTIETPQILSMDTRVFVRTPTGEQIPAIVDKYNSKDASYIVRYEDGTTLVQSWTKLRKMEDDELTRFAAVLPLKEDMPPPPKVVPRTKTKAPSQKRKGKSGGQKGSRKKKKNQKDDEASEGDEDDGDASDEEKEGGSHDLQCSEGEEEAIDEETEFDREFIDDSGLN